MQEPAQMSLNQSFQFSTQKQRRIYEKLSTLISNGSAAFFKDACRHMTETPAFDTATHLVAHLLREIESSMRDILEPVSSQQDRSTETVTNYKNQINSIIKKCNINPALPEVEAFFKLFDNTGVPRQHEKEVIAILNNLGIPLDSQVGQDWLGLTQHGQGLDKRAHRESLWSPRKIDQTFEEFWEKMQTMLDEILKESEAHYSNIYNLVDKILDDGSKSIADKSKLLREKIPHNVVSFRYLFEHPKLLENPVWPDFLYEAGFFKEPPEPEVDEEGRGVSFQNWPQSRYLLHIVEQAPDAVTQIAVSLPQTTNLRVHEDLAEIASKLPGDKAIRFVPLVNDWLKNPYQLSLPHLLGNFVVHLAKENQHEASLEVLRDLLMLTPEPEKPMPVYYKVRQLNPTTSIRLHDYYFIIEENVPVVTQLIGEPIFELLCNILEPNSIAYTRQDETGNIVFDGVSWSRKAIETHEQNVMQDATDALISALRDTAVVLIKKGLASVTQLTAKLEQLNGSIFHRMLLFLLWEFPPTEQEDTTQIIKTQLLSNINLMSRLLWHEYSLVLRKYFIQVLSKPEQDLILNWIYNLGENSESSPSNTSQPLINEVALEPDISTLKLHCLERIGREQLDADVQLYFDKLVANFGSQSHPEFLAYISVSLRGYSDPSRRLKTYIELGLSSASDIVPFLKEWQSGSSFDEASTEYQAQQLEQYIASNPLSFALEAKLFRSLSTDYILAFLVGVKNASERNIAFNWEPVLQNLCYWIAKQPLNVLEANHPITDPHAPKWEYIRLAMCDLIMTGLSNNQNTITIPFELRFTVWQILEELLQDNSADAGVQEHSQESDHFDLLTSALNSTAGRTVQSVIFYARWVQKHPTKGTVSANELTFDTMNEVSRALAYYLHQDLNNSLLIRAILGHYLPTLISLDKNWVRKNLKALFPLKKNLTALHKATWEGYVTYNSLPDKTTFKFLRKQYQFATASLQTVNKDTSAKSQQVLVKHLVDLYISGLIKLEGSSSLFHQFLSVAESEFRQQAIKYAGLKLMSAKGQKIPPQTIKRFTRLWEYWFHESTRAKLSSDMNSSLVAELTEFGWWFSSGFFNTQWGLERLAFVLEITGKVEHSEGVIEQIALLAAEHPVETINCLDLMCKGSVERRYITASWRVAIQNTLKAIYDTNSEVAHNKANFLINILLSRGYDEYRQYLTNSSQE